MPSHLSEILGFQVIVENAGSVGRMISANRMAKASPTDINSFSATSAHLLKVKRFTLQAVEVTTLMKLEPAVGT
jgi:hypothetical protein